jgi:hypothetical protein
MIALIYLTGIAVFALVIYLTIELALLHQPDVCPRFSPRQMESS